MNNPEKFYPGQPGDQSHSSCIAFFADKYGVSREKVITAISIAGTDKQSIEAILRRERFVR